MYKGRTCVCALLGGHAGPPLQEVCIDRQKL